MKYAAPRRNLAWGMILLTVFCVISVSSLWAFESESQCRIHGLIELRDISNDGFFRRIAQFFISLFGDMLRLMLHIYCRFAEMLGFEC
jgi:hypothetical protein